MSFEISFKALADPVRQDILQLLKNGQKSAGEIASHFGLIGLANRFDSKAMAVFVFLILLLFCNYFCLHT